MKRNSRRNNEIRPVRITPDFSSNAFGSVLFEMGETRIICAVSVSSDVPDHAKRRGTGWLSAEYSLLPYSTNPRTGRELLKRDGRSVEIQRLIGRSLRCAVDLKALENFSVTVDCDVLKADGGTRTAAINGAFIALNHAFSRMIGEGMIKNNPVVTNVAAISAGILDGEVILDLDYSEDSRAEVDMNIVMDGNLNFIEIQGTGEKISFSRNQLDSILAMAEKGIAEIIQLQNSFR